MGVKVIIVGAGIAGLCAAVSLRRAGCDVEIFEKSAFATEIGAALTLTPNAALVLERLGFSIKRSRACTVNAWTTVDGATLETLNSIDLSKSEQMFGAPGRTVHRIDLHSELLRLATEEHPEQPAGKPVKLRLGAHVVRATTDGSIVLHDGSTYSADFVVAADGLHSVVRDAVLGSDSNEKAPWASGHSAFRFLIETEVLEKDPELAPLLETKPSIATTFVDSDDPRPRRITWYSCRDGKTQNFVGIHPTKKYHLEVDDVNATKNNMKKEFGHFHEKLKRIIDLAEHVKCWPLLTHDPYPRWVRGRVVLIGDAVHPILPFGGQGGNMAIEDGGALGFLFKDVVDPDQVESRLELFERVRKNRASRVQVLSSVSSGSELEVEAEVRRFADSDETLIPKTGRERTMHNYGYDVFGACQTALRSVAV